MDAKKVVEVLPKAVVAAPSTAVPEKRQSLLSQVRPKPISAFQADNLSANTRIASQVPTILAGRQDVTEMGEMVYCGSEVDLGVKFKSFENLPQLDSPSQSLFREQLKTIGDTIER